MNMHGMKNEHLSIESDLEYLIKPDVCPDWATHLTFVSKDSDKDFILPFTHLRIAQGKVGDRDVHHLEISHSHSFSDVMLRVIRDVCEYPILRLSYGVANTEDIKRLPKILRSIDFQDYLKIAFHCSTEKVGLWESRLYLTVDKAELVVDDTLQLDDTLQFDGKSLAALSERMAVRIKA